MSEYLDGLFHLREVYDLVGDFFIGQEAVVELMKERSVPREATIRCLNALISGGFLWSPRPFLFSRLR